MWLKAFNSVEITACLGLRVAEKGLRCGSANFGLTLTTIRSKGFRDQALPMNLSAQTFGFRGFEHPIDRNVLALSISSRNVSQNTSS